VYSAVAGPEGLGSLHCVHNASLLLVEQPVLSAWCLRRTLSTEVSAVDLLLVQQINKPIVHFTIKTFSSKLCLIFVSANGHFGKWPPRPPGGSWLHIQILYNHNILVYLCAKIGAFIKKCSIGWNINCRTITASISLCTSTVLFQTKSNGFHSYDSRPGQSSVKTKLVCNNNNNNK